MTKRKAPERWRNAIVRYADEDPASLLANPQNWRVHPREQTAALNGSLTELGWIAPVIVNETTQHVVDGHARIGEAIARNEPTVPVAYVHLTEEQERVALATFDPIAAMAGTDQAMLDELLAGLHVEDQRLVQFLATLRSDEPKVLHEDDADLTPPTEPITKSGDLWLLGDHRLLCGDSTKAEDVARLMGEEKAAIVFTDPPYGIALDTDWSGRIGSTGYGREYPPVIGDDVPFDIAKVCIPECAEQFWWGADYYRATIPLGGSWFVWDKRAESQDSMMGAAFELCWSSKEHKRELVRIPWVGFVAHDPREGREHPTQKPIELAAWFISRFSDSDGVVWDGFLGSGWTLVAAEQLGRRCYAMEIEPAYVDVSVRRWENLTGRKAVRERQAIEVHA